MTMTHGQGELARPRSPGLRPQVRPGPAASKRATSRNRQRAASRSPGAQGWAQSHEQERAHSQELAH